MNKKWIINSFNKDFSWVKEYTDNYIVYDKTCSLRETEKVKHQKNVGYNIYDILKYIIDNYDELPDVCVFIKANVFKHCKKETFDKLILNNNFTPIEDYSHVEESSAHIKDIDGGYMEINNSWYIPAHIQTYGQEVNKYYQNYNTFLEDFFEKPIYYSYIRFAPGGQYIVPKENILYYSKHFYEKLIKLVDYHTVPSEAHILERALFYIFTNRFKEKL